MEKRIGFEKRIGYTKCENKTHCKVGVHRTRMRKGGGTMIGVAILDQDPMIRSLLETHVKKVEGYEIIGSMESIEELKQY